MTAPMLRMPATMRRVNDRILETIEDGGNTVPVPFFCECERDGCYRPVWLTPVEYEQRRRRPGWFALAASHGETARAGIEQTLPATEARCASCGYGVARQSPPDRCPMYGGRRWQLRPQAAPPEPGPNLLEAAADGPRP